MTNPCKQMCHKREFRERDRETHLAATCGHVSAPTPNNLRNIWGGTFPAYCMSGTIVSKPSHPYSRKPASRQSVMISMVSQSRHGARNRLSLGKCCLHPEAVGCEPLALSRFTTLADSVCHL